MFFYKLQSARRKIIKQIQENEIELSTLKELSRFTKKIGPTKNKHDVVLARCGKTQNLVWVRYKPIREKFNCKSVNSRVSRRSKYSVKK